jgi:outer membrane receptor protein involved in Fe transport
LLEIDLFSRFSSQTEERTLVRNAFVDEAFAGYGTINANFNLITPKHFKVALQLTNLTDKKYSTGTENLYAKGRSAALLLVLKF